MPILLRALVATATPLICVALSGCTMTTHSSTCENNECTVSLNGASADATLYNDT